MRADVEESLAEARNALPAADSVGTWKPTTRSVCELARDALDVGDAEDHLRALSSGTRWANARTPGGR